MKGSHYDQGDRSFLITSEVSLTACGVSGRSGIFYGTFRVSIKSYTSVDGDSLFCVTTEDSNLCP